MTKRATIKKPGLTFHSILIVEERDLKHHGIWNHPHKSGQYNPLPIASMHGIFTYIYHKNQPNAGKYTIHVTWVVRARYTKQPRGPFFTQLSHLQDVEHLQVIAQLQAVNHLKAGDLLKRCTLSPTIMEVENGCLWKVTTIGRNHFSLPLLWEEGYGE